MAPLAAWSAGLLLQLWQAVLWPATDYLLLGLLGLLLLGLGVALRRSRRLAGTGALLVGLVALGLACAGGRALIQQARLLDPALDQQVLWLEGTVDALPQTGPEGVWLLVEVARGGHTPEPSPSDVPRLPERIRLFWPSAPPDLAAGERWRWQARLRLPHGLSNPHGFDRELWLWEQGVGATGVVRSGPHAPAPQRLKDSAWRPVERLRGQLARSVRAWVADPRVAGVVAALLVGDQAAIERADWRVFRDTGVAHLMSISGLHITLFAWLARALVARLWRAAARLWPGWLLRWPVPHAAGWGGLALAAAYALLAGWGVPAQRTVFMLGVLTWLRWRGADWPWPLQWLLVLAAVLTLDPWAGLQAGFWLSFVAVMLLFVAAPGAQDGAAGLLPRRQRWLAAALRLLREQWVMTVALAPLTLLLFGQVSVAGLLANLLAIPWVTLVVTPLALAGVLVPPLWVACGWAVHALLVLLQPLAGWTYAVWHVPAAPGA